MLNSNSGPSIFVATNNTINVLNLMINKASQLQEVQALALRDP
jgi:hypothetical protein